jgi:hypothetical protein
MARPPWRSERGQATLEWTALVAVVAAVLVLAGAVAGGPGIVNAVGGALRQALCLAGGGSCRPAEPEACVVSSSDRAAKAGVKLTFLKLEGRVGLLREQRSDGSFRLTLVDGGEVGVTAGLGARARVELAGLLDARAGGMSKAEVVARLGRRRVWVVGSEGEADELARRLIELVARERARGLPVVGGAAEAAARLAGADGPGPPAPDEESVGLELEGGASGGLDLGAQARAGLRATLGATQDRAGRRTVVFSLAAEGSIDLRRALLGLHATGTGSVAVELRFDSRGRPVELQVSAVAGGDGHASVLDGAAGGQSGRVHRGVRVEVTGTLDLTTGDHAAVARRLLAGLAPGRTGRLVAAAGELAGRLERAGTLTREVRGTSREAYGAGGEVALGAALGLEVEGSQVASTLRDAWWRPPGGVWDRRLDCLGDRA